MARTFCSSSSSTAFTRINRVLSYIHTHLDQPLSLNVIAKQSCWSRWQLQRVFQEQTGLSVATYVRELKLSQGAERLIDGTERVIDIALDLGFSSEISFSRAFKQMFQVSPRAYRKLGRRTGVRKPFEAASFKALQSADRFIEVRVETREAFSLLGINERINGLFSLAPDFHVKVPALWQKLEQHAETLGQHTAVGVVDVTQSHFDGSNIFYWAGTEVDEQFKFPELPVLMEKELELLKVPSQTYAVIKHKGCVSELPSTLQWFLLNWLPQSQYRGIDGYELERYPANYRLMGEEAAMEYWVPIEHQ
tara:strand:+ start:2497 stop:3417 length:921 start_codon:yes stop_codon:yes gene_type:complete